MDVSEQINSVINNLAEKLGVAAEKLYPVLVKQVYVDAVSKAVTSLVGLAVIIAVIFVIKKLKSGWWKKLSEMDHNRYETIDDELSRGLTIAGVSMAGIIGILLFLVPISGIVGRIINPDWYAIQMILEKISGQ